MAYAEIRFGQDAGLYVDGIKSSGYEPERDHLTMEDWSHHAGRHWSEFEWVEASTWTAQTFLPLGSDMVVYQTRYGIDDSDNVKRWVYACGDVKESRARLRRDRGSDHHPRRAASTSRAEDAPGACADRPASRQGDLAPMAGPRDTACHRAAPWDREDDAD